MNAHQEIPGIEIFGQGTSNFTLPYGYVDSTGHLHREIVLRELSGEEEDDLDSNGLISSERTTRVLVSCIEKLGTITDKKEIEQAVSGTVKGLSLTYLDRLVAMLYLRQISLGSVYKFERSCSKCKKIIKNKQLNLKELEIPIIKNPLKRRATIKLPKSEKIATIKCSTAVEETAILLSKPSIKDIKYYAILARLDSLDDQKLSISPESVDIVKNLSNVDCNYIINAYTLIEGDLDTDIQVSCKNEKCKAEFEFPLDLGQSYFLRPGRESRGGGVELAKGPRFFAFLPLGNKARLEYEVLCLFESYQMDEKTVMNMSCSRRHRYIKMREMVVDSQKKTTEVPTTPGLYTSQSLAAGAS